MSSSANASAVVVVVSDLHCGSTLGLCPAAGVEWEGGSHHPHREQVWMWSQWLDFIDRVKSVHAKRRYVVVNGDAIDGQVKETAQVFTTSRKVQRDAAIECLEPLIKTADRLFVVRGTAAHVGKISENEEQIGEDLGSEQSPEGTYSWYQVTAEWGGMLFDISHHPPGRGGRPWTRGGAAVRLAAEAVHAGGRGERIPDLVIRSHTHLYEDSYLNVEGCRGIITPGWQLRTEYGWRIAGQQPAIGGLIMEVAAGELVNHPAVLYRRRPTNIWREVSKKGS